jgi:hypothetical protein
MVLGGFDEVPLLKGRVGRNEPGIFGFYVGEEVAEKCEGGIVFGGILLGVSTKTIEVWNEFLTQAQQEGIAFGRGELKDLSQSVEGTGKCCGEGAESLKNGLLGLFWGGGGHGCDWWGVGFG